jgi:hypothetical protein
MWDSTELMRVADCDIFARVTGARDALKPARTRNACFCDASLLASILHLCATIRGSPLPVTNSLSWSILIDYNSQIARSTEYQLDCATGLCRCGIAHCSSKCVRDARPSSKAAGAELSTGTGMSASFTPVLLSSLQTSVQPRKVWPDQPLSYLRVQQYVAHTTLLRILPVQENACSVCLMAMCSQVDGSSGNGYAKLTVATSMLVATSMMLSPLGPSSLDDAPVASQTPRTGLFITDDDAMALPKTLSAHLDELSLQLHVLARSIVAETCTNDL